MPIVETVDFSGQDPQACGLSTNATTLYDTGGNKMDVTVPGGMNGSSCRVELRYNKCYCWFRYNGGNSNHTDPSLRLMSGSTVLLQALSVPQAVLWSVCSSKCNGKTVIFQYQSSQGMWLNIGTNIIVPST